MPEHSYDFGIAGGGLSGLLTAEMLSRNFPDAKMLFVDASFAPRNDRTWCYWTDGKSPFPELVSASWPEISLRFRNQTIISVNPKLRYECISEQDFRSTFFGKLRQNPNITFLEKPIRSITEHTVFSELKTENNESFSCAKIFQSVFKPSKSEPARYELLQHFLGWEIEVEAPVFDSRRVMLMDFDVAQSNGFSFMYVLPFSPERALIECTFFSRKPVEAAVYESMISDWILKQPELGTKRFRIVRKEHGIIPMNDSFASSYAGHTVVDIGTPAGFVKPSTGYAFNRTVERVGILEAFLTGKTQTAPLQSSRLYRMLDSILLHVLDRRPEIGPALFFNLFKRRGFDAMFRFLDEKSNPADVLAIMMSVPSLPFLSAGSAILKSPVSKSR